MYWQGLGYAEYRSGNWKAAVQAFEKVKELGSAGDSLEWFPLSMAYWQLGDKDAARKTYDQAVQWMEKNNPKDGFLLGLRAEAAKLDGDRTEERMNRLCSTVSTDRLKRTRRKAAGGVLTAKQAPHRPGTAPALGLRAGNDVCRHCIADHTCERRLTMSFTSWLKSCVNSSLRAGRHAIPTAAARRPTRRLRLEPSRTAACRRAWSRWPRAKQPPNSLASGSPGPPRPPTAGPTPVYQFSAAPHGGAFHVVRDFSPANAFAWTPMQEGTYDIEVTVKDGYQATETTSAVAADAVASRVTGSQAVVTPTLNPLVALYSVPPSSAGTVFVQFAVAGDHPSWRNTDTRAVVPGKSTNFFVAGMLPNTTYQMRHVLSDGTGSAPLLFTTGALPSTLTFPTFTVSQPPGPGSDLGPGHGLPLTRRHRP